MPSSSCQQNYRVQTPHSKPSLSKLFLAWLTLLLPVLAYMGQGPDKVGSDPLPTYRDAFRQEGALSGRFWFQLLSD